MQDKKEELLRCAKELFIEQGFKNTNVAEITKLAGMATGTFYNYYPSKDQLFMEIYNEENVKLKKSLVESLDMQRSPQEIITEFMARNLEGMSANPILREWYNKEVFNKIEKSFRDANGLEHVDFLYSGFIPVVEQWQRGGKMRSDISAEMIMAIFSALITIDTHKEDIGIQYFPALMEYLSAFILNGLEPSGDK